MSKKKINKVMMIGIDGLMFEMVDKFSREGILPHMSRLIEGGFFSKSFPSPPCDTPTNWTTLATGAWTGTHGNNTFDVHYQGESFEVMHGSRQSIFPDFLSIFKKPAGQESLNKTSQAEFLWEALARLGKKSILVNWPGGWPPTIDDLITVDGSGPYSSPLCRINNPQFFSSQPLNHEKNYIPLTLRPAQSWRNIPASHHPPLETALVISGEGTVEIGDQGWVIKPASDEITISENLIRHLLIIDSQGQGYDKLIISRTKDAADVLATLKVNQWSPWLKQDLDFEKEASPRPFLNPEPYSVQVKTEAHYRLKLLKLTSDGNSLTLYRTSMFNLKGWAHPQNIAGELIEHLFQQGQKKSTELMMGTDGTTGEVYPPSPVCMVYESVEDQARGIPIVCQYLGQKYPWDLMMVQIHAPDGLNHQALNGVCPGASGYDPEKEEETWNRFRKTYQELDRMIGKILDLVDEHTLVAVVSDHAALPNKATVNLVHYFERAGLTAFKKDKKTGNLVVDWSRTRAVVGNFPLMNVWVNLKGRDPWGIVEPGQEYEKVINEALEVLYSIKDPLTGEHPIVLALRKEDAEFLGQWGKRVGDIVYYFTPGYMENPHISGVGPINPRIWSEESIQRKAMGWHDCYLPSAQYSGFSDCGILIMQGQGIKRGYRRPKAAWTVDVIPTLCFLAGFPLPAQSEGKVIIDGLDL